MVDLAVLARFSLESVAGEEAEEEALGAAHGAAEPGGPAAAGEAEGLRGARSAGGTAGPTRRGRPAGCVPRQRPLLLRLAFTDLGEGSAASGGPKGRCWHRFRVPS